MKTIFQLVLRTQVTRGRPPRSARSARCRWCSPSQCGAQLERAPADGTDLFGSSTASAWPCRAGDRAGVRLGRPGRPGRGSNARVRVAPARRPLAVRARRLRGDVGRRRAVRGRAARRRVRSAAPTPSCSSATIVSAVIAVSLCRPVPRPRPTRARALVWGLAYVVIWEGAVARTRAARRGCRCRSMAGRCSRPWPTTRRPGKPPASPRRSSCRSSS